MKRYASHEMSAAKLSGYQKLKSAKTFLERGDAAMDAEIRRHQKETGAVVVRRSKIRHSLTHGFFGELGDEIFSKQAIDYVKESVVYLFQAALHETQNLMSIMQTNKGRDKIFGLV